MRTRLLLMAMVTLLAAAGTAVATESYPWRDHAEPFSYQFGNHIDTHQQSLVEDGMLEGFFYITLSDETDGDSGLLRATHGNCEMRPEGCSVGWVWHGRPAWATLLAHGGGEHPTWCVDPADMPRARGYTHFHWVGPPNHAHDLQKGAKAEGWLLRLTAIDAFFFEHHGGFAITPGIDLESHANIVTDC